MSSKSKKLGLGAVTLMMFTTIFGFANGPVAFAQMGYAAIIWYLLGGLLFFLPTAMMYAEFGASYTDAKGGIYTWMEEALGQKVAFIATFVGLASWITWMIGVAQKVWIPFSTLFAGHDATQSWSLFGMSSGETVGVLAALFVIVVASFVNRGVSAIARISSIGGVFVMALNGILLLASVVILLASGGHFAEPVQLHSFLISSNPAFQSPFQMISFALYAIFAYAGLEQMGSVMENIDEPEKTYPKGAIIATIVIGIGYSLSILLWGVSTNWLHLSAMKSANLGNITYVLMNNLGVQLGQSLHLTEATALLLGDLFTRFAGIGMFMAYVGSFFYLTYGPIKSFILGTPKEFWPARVVRLNKHGIPATAVWAQAIIVVVLILGISFGGKNASQLYLILTNMGNVSTTLPYVFLVLAFPFFKRLPNVKRPFVFFKSAKSYWPVTILVELLMLLSIGLTIWEPFSTGDWFDGMWTILGPVLFAIIAWILFARAEKHEKTND